MIALAVHRKPAVLMLAAALLAVLALWAALQPAVARAEEPSGDIVTVLQPGENLVGWIAAEAPVGDLFAAVPEIEAVWAWDARSRRWRVASPRVPEALHSLPTLRPGMGLLVQIGGDQPVEWTRSAVPARGLVQLRPGPNLVAWSGPDDSQIGWWSKGVGISLVSAGVPSGGERGWSLYDPEDAASAEAFPAINRGDALWVTSSRNINWLQPTGVLPKIEFPGGASQQLQEQMHSYLLRTLEFYGETYAIQADFANLTAYVPKSREALNAVDGQWVESEFWESGAGGWAGLDSFVVKRRGASGLGPDYSPRGTLSHEYFHIIQEQLAGLSGFAPLWLLEGITTWMQWRHGEEQGFDGLGVFDFSERTRVTRSNRASLESSSQPYAYGLVASDFLAQRAGGDALIEFWRLQPWLDDGSVAGSYIAGSYTLWRDAFLEAFGVDVAEFYSAFCRFRRGEMTPDYDDDTLCLDDGVRVVSGALVDDEGTAIIGAVVRAEPLDGWRESDFGRVGRPIARTDSQGRFALRFADSGTGPTGLHVAIGGLCAGWYAAGGLVRGSTAIPFDDSIADIRITVPSGTCRRIEGAVVGPDGVGLPGATVVLSRVRESARSHTASDGSFAFVASSRHIHTLWVEFGDGCAISFAGGDNVAPFTRFGNLTIDELDGIRLVVPENACRWSVRGRLVDSNGEGVAGRRVSLLHEGPGGTLNQTGPDGSFSFVVPLPGQYQFRMEHPDCAPGPYHSGDGGATFDQSQAALLSLGTQDVSGLVLRLPDDACDDR